MGKLIVFGIDKIYDNDLFVIFFDGLVRICVDDFDIGINIVVFFLN